MATLNLSLVESELRKVMSRSQALKHLVRDRLRELEEDPTQFKELRVCPPEIATRRDVTLRKLKFKHQRHEYRLIVAHWSTPGEIDHCDALLLFPRKDDYDIDWEWVEQALKS